ncbi:hypothetical protein FACS189452_02260 [Bacteroidia bacterium]|nr:hypothetical protein FACS189452_02260 [Bacteroidia bacterium]GHT79967.1 hypothetical protein FACS189467_0800 [Bacteroidia bacterium]
MPKKIKIESKKTLAKGKVEKTKRVKKVENVETKKPVDTVSMGKKHIAVSYRNVRPDVLKLLHLQYPLGWRDHIIKVNKSETDFFFAVTLDTPEICYLIKVDVEIDSREKLEEDRELFGTDEALNEEETGRLPSKEDEEIADEDTE